MTKDDRLGKGYGPFALELLKALGLPQKGIRGVELRVHANELVLVTIERFVYEHEAKKVLELIDQYNLVPKDQPQTSISKSDKAVQTAITAPFK